jgi:hypothetical protein
LGGLLRPVRMLLVRLRGSCLGSCLGLRWAIAVGCWTLLLLLLLMLLRSVVRWWRLMLLWLLLLRSVVRWWRLLLHLRCLRRQSLVLGGRGWGQSWTGRLPEGWRRRRRRQSSPSHRAASHGRGGRAGSRWVVLVTIVFRLWGILDIAAAVSIVRWTAAAAVPAGIVIGEVGVVVAVQAPWTVVPEFTALAAITIVNTITRSVATIRFLGILFQRRPTTIVLVALQNKTKQK